MLADARIPEIKWDFYFFNFLHAGTTQNLKSSSFQGSNYASVTVVVTSPETSSLISLIQNIEKIPPSKKRAKLY